MTQVTQYSFPDQHGQALFVRAEAYAELERDAKRWRAFLNCARIRVLGTAGIREPMPDNYAHIGLEVWTTYQGHKPEWNDQQRAWLEQFADIAAKAQP